MAKPSSTFGAGTIITCEKRQRRNRTTKNITKQTRNNRVSSGSLLEESERVFKPHATKIHPEIESQWLVRELE